MHRLLQEAEWGCSEFKSRGYHLLAVLIQKLIQWTFNVSDIRDRAMNDDHQLYLWKLKFSSPCLLICKIGERAVNHRLLGTLNVITP